MIKQAFFPAADATHLAHFGEQFPRSRFSRLTDLPFCKTDEAVIFLMLHI